MATTIINFRTEEKVKKEAQSIAEEMGLKLSDVLNVLLRNFTREKKITSDIREGEYTEYFKKSMAEAMEQVKNGDVVSFNNTEDALDYLHKIAEK
ncbi:MAG: type II toxin-antitoxin system RelB/DinJ family antitoxin [bacterium]